LRDSLAHDVMKHHISHHHTQWMVILPLFSSCSFIKMGWKEGRREKILSLENWKRKEKERERIVMMNFLQSSSLSPNHSHLTSHTRQSCDEKMPCVNIFSHFLCCSSSLPPLTPPDLLEILFPHNMHASCLCIWCSFYILLLFLSLI